jgi:radical SAM superfamily enzyme YgiQ (UPF0313 family)
MVIPYFISSHPGSRPEDMAELALKTKDPGFRLEQVQDFTPTPMTVATELRHRHPSLRRQQSRRRPHARGEANPAQLLLLVQARNA